MPEENNGGAPANPNPEGQGGAQPPQGQQDGQQNGANQGGEQPPKKSYEELQAELAKANQQIEVFKEKDYNFNALKKKRLSQLSEEELAKLTEKEKMIMAQNEEVLSKFDQLHEKTKKNMLDRLSNNDEKLREKIEKFYDEIAAPSDTEEQMMDKMERAYVQATAKRPKVNPLAQNVSSFGAPNYQGAQEKTFDQTERGKGFLSLLGPQNHKWADTPPKLDGNDPTQVPSSVF